MAVQKMKKICLCAGKQDRKAVLEMLQRMGTVEIRREDPAGDGLNQMDVSEALAGLEAPGTGEAVSVCRPGRKKAAGGRSL